MARHEFTDPTPAGRAGETALPVWVEPWEIECCAPPPVVGERGSWWLFFVPASDDGADSEFARTWSCIARPLISDGRPDPFGAVLDIAGAAVFWHGDQLVAGLVPEGRRELRGHLAGTAHGGSVPEEVGRTAGVVRRLRVASQTFARLPGGPWAPVPGTMTLTDRLRSPRSFQRAHSLPDDQPRRQETAVLIDLAVQPIAPR